MYRILSIASLLCLIVSVNAMAQKKIDEAYVKQLVANNAVALGYTQEDLSNYRLSSYYYDNTSGAVMAYLQQTYKGVDIFNAVIPVAFKNEKLVVSASGDRIQGVDKLVTSNNAVPAIAASAALQSAAQNLNLPLSQSFTMPMRQSPDGQEFEFDKLGIGFNNIIVRLMWAPENDQTQQLKLCWQVAILTIQTNDLWIVKVDANSGNVLRKDNLTAKENYGITPLHKMDCYTLEKFAEAQKSRILNPQTYSGKGVESVTSAKYNVIPYPAAGPNESDPVLVTDPWTLFANTNATTLKWNSNSTRDFDSTQGNNVYAHYDPADKDKNGNAAKSSTTLPNLTFNFTPDFGSDPLEDINTINFGITNVFYWNNLMHDMSYSYGFDEAAGNFQASNLARGGKENDHVVADAQDGSGQTGYLDNANFSTPVDGSQPRMQMYLWSQSILKITEITAPSSIAGYYPSTESGFSTNNKLSSVGTKSSELVYYRDFADSTKHAACGAPYKQSEIVGKIVYIDRRGCADPFNSFVSKVKNAQTYGAIGAVVGNILTDPDSSGLITMGGTDNTITIPAVFLSTDDANTIKAQLDAKVKTDVVLHAGLRTDGDLDNTIHTHEYTHGISNRLTGGPNNTSCLNNQEQMGEGWSDYEALMMTTNWATATVNDGPIPRAIGTYVYGYTDLYPGIRYFAYSTDFKVNQWTYGATATDSVKVNGIPEVHYIGEVWCTMLWEMTWEIIKNSSINTNFFDASKPGGNSVAQKLVIEGMKLQKCSPGFVDGRDAILKADTMLYSGAYSAAIWRAFARRGLGYSAKQGSSSTVADNVAAYDLPPVLPALFGSFTAQKVNNTALLKWTTVTEQNLDRFVVERTVDGVNYSEVGSVKAAGNSTLQKSYSFTDVKPVKGSNIYRIRMVDYNGRITISDARSLNFDVANSISVAPNPAHSKVVLTVKDNTKTLQVKIFNNVGQQVASFVLNGESMPIDVSKLQSGAYYISVTGDGVNHKEKVIVQ